MLLSLVDLQVSVHGRSDPLFWAMGTRKYVVEKTTHLVVAKVEGERGQHIPLNSLRPETCSLQLHALLMPPPVQKSPLD